MQRARNISHVARCRLRELHHILAPETMADPSLLPADIEKRRLSLYDADGDGNLDATERTIMKYDTNGGHARAAGWLADERAINFSVARGNPFYWRVRVYALAARLRDAAGATRRRADVRCTAVAAAAGACSTRWCPCARWSCSCCPGQ